MTLQCPDPGKACCAFAMLRQPVRRLPRRVAHVRGRQLSTLKWRSHHLTGSKDKEPGEEGSWLKMTNSRSNLLACGWEDEAGPWGGGRREVRGREAAPWGVGGRGGRGLVP